METTGVPSRTAPDGATHAFIPLTNTGGGLWVQFTDDVRDELLSRAVRDPDFRPQVGQILLDAMDNCRRGDVRKF